MQGLARACSDRAACHGTQDAAVSQGIEVSWFRSWPPQPPHGRPPKCVWRSTTAIPPAAAPV